MGKPRIFRNADRYPFSDKNCSGSQASKGLRRQIKDGELTIMSAEAMIWSRWKPHERNNAFAKWLRRRKKRVKR
jgi:hypothetical protein